MSEKKEWTSFDSFMEEVGFKKSAKTFYRYIKEIEMNTTYCFTKKTLKFRNRLTGRLEEKERYVFNEEDLRLFMELNCLMENGQRYPVKAILQVFKDYLLEI